MLELSTHDVDLGTIEQGVTKHFQISVKNTSGTPITPRLSASCGCTTPTLEPATVPAHGVSQLLVKFDTMGKQGFQSKNAYVNYTNNGNPIQLLLNFKANIHVKDQM